MPTTTAAMTGIRRKVWLRTKGTLTAALKVQALRGRWLNDKAPGPKARVNRPGIGDCSFP